TDSATTRIGALHLHHRTNILLPTTLNNRSGRIGCPFEHIGGESLSGHTGAELPRLMPLVNLLLISLSLITCEDRKEARKRHRYKGARAIRPLELAKEILYQPCITACIL